MKFNKLIKDFNNFIFDFDGVILNSVEIKNQVFYKFFLKYGDSIAKKIFNYHVQNLGIDRFIKFEHIFNNIIKTKISDKDKLFDTFSDYIMKELFEAQLVNGIEIFLKNLNLNFKKCFILSAAPQIELQILLKKNHISNLFINYLGSPNNKYENFNLLLLENDFNINKTIYFGDSVSDYKFAYTNNLKFISVGNELKKYKLSSNYLNILDFDEIKY